MSEKEIVIPISKIKSKPDIALEQRLKEELDFQVKEIEDDLYSSKHNMQVLKEGQIAVKFPKFIQLIATHEFEEIVEKHKNEEVIITSDLLVDLAGSSTYNEDGSDNKFSFIVLGVMLGLMLSAIIFLLLLK